MPEGRYVLTIDRTIFIGVPGADIDAIQDALDNREQGFTFTCDGHVQVLGLDGLKIGRSTALAPEPPMAEKCCAAITLVNRQFRCIQ